MYMGPVDEAFAMPRSDRPKIAWFRRSAQARRATCLKLGKEQPGQRAGSVTHSGLLGQATPRQLANHGRASLCSGSESGRCLSVADYVRDRRAIWKAWEATAACPGADVDYPLIAPTPDYAKLVEAYGGAGERVTKPAELQAAIERALATLASGRSARLDVFGEP